MNPTSHFAGHFVIRAIRPDDGAAVMDIRRQPQVMRYTPAMPSDRPADHYARWGTNDHVLVAELDGRVVGYAGLHVRDGKRRHSAWLGIAVHDEFAGRGAGQLLMKGLLDLADRWIGLVRVDLEANADNERAIAMYRRFGFVEEGRQKKAYFSDGGYVDNVIMARLR
ncbi:MAG: GNAT family N-acetyltransferase [Myxococcales bacterium]|nr:GNAT family N-acetyltransferase [Myxococcales bacterium]